MVTDRENVRYLPSIKFPKNLNAYPDLSECLDSVRDILIVVPSHGLRSTLMTVLPLLNSDSRICWATKGFELQSGKLPHQVAAEVLGQNNILKEFLRRGGLRCQVLSSSNIKVGDKIKVLD